MHTCIIACIASRLKRLPDEVLLARLGDWAKASGYTGRSLAAEIGFAQATVCRALQGKLDRDSGAFRAICRKAGLAMQVCIEGVPSTVVEAFSALWDGSEEHATAIASLLEAARAVSKKGKPAA
jgi:hypothetical protein